MPNDNTIFRWKHVVALAALIKNQLETHTHSTATESTDGFMSAADKAKLDNLSTPTIDSALSNTSTNAVQNRAVHAAIEAVKTAIATEKSRIDSITDGADEALDSFKEFSDYLANHQTEYEALEALVGDKVTKEAGKGLSTNDFTTAEKNKLEGIAEGANNYTLPTASTTLGGVKTTSSVSNITGYTPVPIINGVPYYKDTTYSAATTTTAGLMSAADKATLDNLAADSADEITDAEIAALFA